jgi:hypothetical protein
MGHGDIATLNDVLDRSALVGKKAAIPCADITVSSSTIICARINGNA